MQWYKRKNFNSEKIERLSKTLNIPDVISSLLLQRGIVDFESAKHFFRPDWSQLHNPFLMKDMNKAVDRIQLAINTNEKVMIFGDYDVDGTTSVALLTDYLKNKIFYIKPYVPDRYSEGYGISKKGIEVAKEEGISLIIALDCGIKAFQEINYAKELGIDFIVCDHHLPERSIPDAVAVLDPKRHDCEYPFKELCGCGIGFKLIQALQTKLKLPKNELIMYSDLVATAIAADIVPIVGENRVLTFIGLKQLQSNPRLGFKILTNQLRKPLKVTDLVFVLAPRINAAGRMDKGLNAVKLMLSIEKQEALSIARKIEFYNKERRYTEELITKEAFQQIKLEGTINNCSSIVYSPSWHKGVIGIVASRLIEKYYRPSIVLTKSEDILTGSARSVSGFDIYKALEACKENLIQFGGHKYAAGLTLKIEQLSKFKLSFEKYAKENISPECKTPSMEYDLDIKFNDISQKLLRIINQMAPFGPKNMRPLFATHNCKDMGRTRLVGNDKTHLQLDISDSTGVRFSGIGYGLGYLLKEIKQVNSFSVLYTIDENEFRGNKNLQLKIKDIRAI
ncbi:MAG: single-stranded-DNA-specific exonuclease RecJ [Flavobacteriaceae bacterium]